MLLLRIYSVGWVGMDMNPYDVGMLMMVGSGVIAVGIGIGFGLGAIVSKMLGVD